MSWWDGDDDFHWDYVPHRHRDPRCNKCHRRCSWHEVTPDEWVLYEKGQPHRCGTDFGTFGG